MCYHVFLPNINDFLTDLLENIKDPITPGQSGLGSNEAVPFRAQERRNR